MRCILTTKIRFISLTIILCFFILSGVSYAVSLKQEKKIGRRVAEEIAKQYKIIDDPVKLTSLNLVLSKIVPHLKRPDLGYKINIISSDQINAFSIPGGYIYVTTGMLNFIRSKHELASLLAHELVHVDKKHIFIQMARAQKLSVLSVITVLATGAPAGVGIMTQLLSVAILNNYSKDLEREADTEGVFLTKEAGYSPVGMLTLLERLWAYQLRYPELNLGIYATHPSIKNRVNYIYNAIKMAGIKNIYRKKTANYLNTSFNLNNDKVDFFVDDYLLFEFKYDLKHKEKALSFLKLFKQRLDEAYQLELEPYEICLLDNGDVLSVGYKRVATVKELLTCGLSKKEAKNLLKLIEKGLKKHLFDVWVKQPVLVS